MEITEFAVLNTAEALERLDNDKDLYTELIESFLFHTPFDPEILQTLIEESPAADSSANMLTPAAQYVHKIKGAAGNIGADRLFAAAEQLEQVLRGRKNGDTRQLSAVLETCYLQTCKALKSLAL